jgi:hypothetical protein
MLGFYFCDKTLVGMAYWFCRGAQRRCATEKVYFCSAPGAHAPHKYSGAHTRPASVIGLTISVAQSHVRHRIRAFCGDLSSVRHRIKTFCGASCLVRHRNRTNNCHGYIIALFVPLVPNRTPPPSPLLLPQIEPLHRPPSPAPVGLHGSRRRRLPP